MTRLRKFFAAVAVAGAVAVMPLSAMGHDTAGGQGDWPLKNSAPVSITGGQGDWPLKH